jgi:hypothetical protein
MIHSRQHYALALAFLRYAAAANLTLEEKHRFKKRAACFAELSRRAMALEAEEREPEEAPLRPIPLWAISSG